MPAPAAGSVLRGRSGNVHVGPDGRLALETPRGAIFRIEPFLAMSATSGGGAELHAFDRVSHRSRLTPLAEHLVLALAVGRLDVIVALDPAHACVGISSRFTPARAGTFASAGQISLPAVGLDIYIDGVEARLEPEPAADVGRGYCEPVRSWLAAHDRPNDATLALLAVDPTSHDAFSTTYHHDDPKEAFAGVVCADVAGNERSVAEITWSLRWGAGRPLAVDTASHHRMLVFFADGMRLADAALLADAARSGALGPTELFPNIP